MLLQTSLWERTSFSSDHEGRSIQSPDVLPVPSSDMHASPLPPNTSNPSAGTQPAPTVISEKGTFGITRQDIQTFDSNLENLRKYGGVAGIVKALNSDPAHGIVGSPEDLNLRVQEFGSNTYPVTKRKRYWAFLWEAFQDETLVILIVCATVSVIVGLTTEDPKSGWYDGGGVYLAIVLVVLVSSISDYRQSLQFQQLNAEKRKILVTVSRSGRRIKVVIFELVVGDIVHLSIGDQIPGDGLLLGGHSLLVDESSMTGESEPVAKDEEHPFLLSGCKVLDGTGPFLVTSVGMSTEWGKVMATLSEENDEETPLQVRLNSLSTTIGKIGMTVAIVVFIFLLIRFLAKMGDFKHFNASDGHKIVEFFAIAVTIVVVAVPEGLPLAVTLTLAYSMNKMMDDRALVRHLSACETMGSATTICSDKTGTLTMNLMTVVNSWFCGKIRSPSSDEILSKEVTKKLHISICMNTNGFVHFGEGSTPEVTGSPTEVAVLNWGILLGARFDDVKKENTILYVDTFNSTKKRMGIIVKEPDGTVWVHWKGAAEVVLNQCSNTIDVDGTIAPISTTKMDELHGIITSFANAALRTLCLACRQLSEDEIAELDTKKAQFSIPDKNLTCLAIIGIKDPCRPGVPEAVKKCQQAGIKVMARSSPTDKHILVKRLLEMGEIVAVTGDGTNDAPALHEASIGLSMGIVGTEVAKESSDIIILDDNFASIVKVVRWGRSVYNNIQKFIQFQCTVNGVALSLNFLAAVIQGSAPLTAVQLLWVNLIMDTMGALALATEPPDEGLMHRKPIRAREPLITNIMWRNMFGQFAYQLSVLLVLQFRGKEIFNLKSGIPPSLERNKSQGVDHADELLLTIIFNSFVFCQVYGDMERCASAHGDSSQPGKRGIRCQHT